MSDNDEKMELRLDEENELFFKINVFGAERSPQIIRLVCESGDVSYTFKGRATNENDIVCFVVPAMKDAMKAGLYEAKVEVVVDNHYFVPVKFNADFKQPVKVVAESVVNQAKKPVADPEKVTVKAQSVSKSQYSSLREKYQSTKK